MDLSAVTSFIHHALSTLLTTVANTDTVNSNHHINNH